MNRTSLSIIACLATLGAAQAQLPKAGLWAYYNAENGVNGSATALPHKTLVTKWEDISGNKRHLTRVNSTTPMVSKDTGSFGVTAVYFKTGYVYADPGDAGFTTPLTGEKTFFAVVKANSGASRDYVFDGRPATGQVGRTALFVGQSACLTDWTAYMGGLGTIGCGTKNPIFYDRYQIHTLVLAKGKQEHYINGVLVASGTFATVGTLDGLILGARISRALNLDGYITRLAIYSKAVTAAERKVVETLMGVRTPLGYTETYGAGCSDSGQRTASLSWPSAVRSPGSFSLLLAGGTPSSVGVVLMGSQRTSFPIFAASRNCNLLSGPPWWALFTSPTTTAGGFSLGPISIPQGFFGVSFTTQVAVFDNALQDKFAFSNGLEFRVGY